MKIPSINTPVFQQLFKGHIIHRDTLLWALSQEHFSPDATKIVAYHNTYIFRAINGIPTAADYWKKPIMWPVFRMSKEIKLCDRTSDQISLDEVERVVF